jgi:hypothetical protein
MTSQTPCSCWFLVHTKEPEAPHPSTKAAKMEILASEMGECAIATSRTPNISCTLVLVLHYDLDFHLVQNLSSFLDDVEPLSIFS